VFLKNQKIKNKQYLKNIFEMLNNYYKPTPKKWRKLGDAVLAVGTTLTTYAAFMNMKELVIISAICTMIGKFLTNFFSE